MFVEDPIFQVDKSWVECTHPYLLRLFGNGPAYYMNNGGCIQTGVRQQLVGDMSYNERCSEPMTSTVAHSAKNIFTNRVSIWTQTWARSAGLHQLPFFLVEGLWVQNSTLNSTWLGAVVLFLIGRHQHRRRALLVMLLFVPVVMFLFRLLGRVCYDARCVAIWSHCQHRNKRAHSLFRHQI